MDLSSQPSSDEDRIMQRQLYRAGEGNKPASKTPASASSPSAIQSVAPARKPGAKGSAAGSENSKGQRILQMILLLGFGYYLIYGTAEQRRRVFKGLGVAVWLLFLCGVSYCVFLPNLEGIAKDISSKQKAIFEDKSLTADQKREKMGEIRSELSKLTPDQRRAVFEINRKEMIRKGNKDIVGFLQLSKEEQYAAMKKRVDEMEKRRAQWGGRAQNKGGQNKGGGPGSGGPGGGRGGGGGPGGGGWGGGGGGGGNPLGGMADSMSPESRAGRQYQMGMMSKLGGFGGGQGGGPRGGAGGAPGGGGGRR